MYISARAIASNEDRVVEVIPGIQVFTLHRLHQLKAHAVEIFLQISDPM